MTGRVLVATGGLITGKERSFPLAARKWWQQWRAADEAWLDFKVKLVMAEPLLAGRIEARRLPCDLRETLRSQEEREPPSLTEVVLTTLLHRAGLPYERMELDEIFSAPGEVDRKLSATDCVFLSSTYLHDLSEVEPLLRRLKRPHNRIVLGGALAGILHDRWEGAPELDVMAVGYGEMLAEPLAAWIRSGFQTLEPPDGGHLVRKGTTAFLYSGVPRDHSLDFLPTPDWGLAMQDHKTRFREISYESVRGCPYRCNFCNYPYLFDDTRFRTKSATKIAGDWERYVKDLGVETITCLDSLFTMPKPRLRELCHLLVERNVKVKWICYARADDLADEETVVLMKEAGAHQVQIGIESGDARLLANMDKACTVEANARALRNCRQHGLTTVVSLIVGFPGETAETLDRTYRFLTETPPDFYFLATFSTRVAGVPLLQPQNRRRFGLRVMENLRTMAPYWEHDTMSCAEVGNHVRALDRRLMQDRIALNAALFYSSLHSFQPERRETLLDYQQRAAAGHPFFRGAFNLANRWVDRRLRRAVHAHFTPAQA
ncbi:MAG: anaerobic magnesium-protoporphyrin monomethyl ester cyclase [Acidobacteriota bacterium]|nr:anaerobic magnesium-protoporphyrin monomethyl ester cyclase [Acidobacteriota bacterium]